MNKIKVLIADDQTLFREVLQQAIELEDDLEVIGTASDCREAVRLAVELRPDVVLLDIKMPDQDGIWVAEEIKRLAPSCKLIMLTVFGDQEYLESALAAGAHGYLLKNVTRRDIVEGIRRVHAGGSLFDPSVTAAALDHYARRSRGEAGKHARPDGLTRRELEIMRLACDGKSNAEIADFLCISIGTVKTHLYNAYQKTGVSDRLHAALRLREMGL
ncbi:MAG: response regulator transcription factor [Armatimonadetes bacterium]|nr:response regulator transcription factor [Armatimonadota bacterium]